MAQRPCFAGCRAGLSNRAGRQPLLRGTRNRRRALASRIREGEISFLSWRRKFSITAVGQDKPRRENCGEKSRRHAHRRCMLFENRAGKLRYLFAGSIHDDEITLDRASLQSNWAGLLMDLERILIEAGLYQKEARAM